MGAGLDWILKHTKGETARSKVLKMAICRSCISNLETEDPEEAWGWRRAGKRIVAMRSARYPDLNKVIMEIDNRVFR